VSLAKVFVPRHMRVVAGQRQDVEAYTYQRASVRSRAREALKRVPTAADVGADEVPDWEGLSSRQPPTGAPGSVVLHDTPGGEAFFQRVANVYDDQGRLASTAQADIAKVPRGDLQPGEVKALYVATRPDARRQGYATALYDALRESGLDIVPAVGQRGVSAEGAPFARSYLRGLASAPTSLLAKADIEDQRKHGKQPIHLDTDKFEAAATAAGIDISKVKSLKLRFRDLGEEQGVTTDLGGGNYRVVVGIKPKKAYEDRHLYVVNNSLVHELRHVAQYQNGNTVQYKATKQEYEAEAPQHAKEGGYIKLEAEAQMFGRLAWHGDPAKKPLGPLGQDKAHQGKTVWAIGFSPEVPIGKVEGLMKKVKP
jgi:GNAT superfamily N-acetyltransferase